MQKSRQIHRRKQQIPHLFFRLLCILRVQRVTEFRAFFVHFVEDAFGALPIKSNSCRAPRKLKSFERRGQSARHAIQKRTRLPFLFRTIPILLPRRGALLFLDLFPLLQDLCRILRALFTKNVRMPPHHLVVHLANHVGNAKPPLFLRNLRMKHNLQQQIPHLFRKLRVIAALQRLQNLVSLLDQISSQRRVRLLFVPRTPIRSPQPRLHRRQLFEPLPGG